MDEVDIIIEQTQYISPFHCIYCHYNTRIKCDYKKHLLTQKHDRNYKKHLNPEKEVVINSNTNTSSNISIEDIESRKIIPYVCETCEFNTCDKKDYKRHIRTQKHKERYIYVQECNSLSIPELTTIDIKKPESELINEKITIDKNILLELIKQSNDFKQIMIEQNAKLIEIAEKGTTINNTNNNRFNLNFFLNEQCKDAMNINDFINSIEIGFRELEYVGKHGYINGITKIVSDSLNQIGLYKRPIHCTDLKREIIHIRDKDEWKREDEGKEKTKDMIEEVSKKNLRLVGAWQKEHPNYEILDSEEYKEWWNIAKQVNSNYDKKSTPKIIKNIIKFVHIEKEE